MPTYHLLPTIAVTNVGSDAGTPPWIKDYNGLFPFWHRWPVPGHIACARNTLQHMYSLRLRLAGLTALLAPYASERMLNGF